MDSGGSRWITNIILIGEYLYTAFIRTVARLWLNVFWINLNSFMAIRRECYAVLLNRTESMKPLIADMLYHFYFRFSSLSYECRISIQYQKFTGIFGLYPSSGSLKTWKRTTFKKLDLFSSSCERGKTPQWGPIERVTLLQYSWVLCTIVRIF